MKKHTDPFDAESKPAVKDKAMKEVDDAIAIITDFATIKELRIICMILILCILITGIVYNLIFIANYWQISVPVLAALFARIYYVIRNKRKKK